MHIIIGLGNPGKEFEKTRHNVGFMAVDKFAEINNFPEFSLNKKSNALISDKENVLLAKPQTFMNKSGQAVKKIIENKELESIIVIHDDIDLPVGKIKIIKERGSAGHKGVESIIKSIGNKDLVRFRIGIASPAEASAKAGQIVLKNFSNTEQEIINDVLQKTCSALELFLKEGLEKAMNQYN